MTEQEATHLTIVVPSDGSEVSARALPYALALATPGTEVILLNVIEREEPIRNLAGHISESADVQTRRAAEQARQELIDLTKDLNMDKPVTFTELVRAGEPAKEIAAVAEEVGADLLIMASHGRGAAGRWTFGSVADEVSRAAGPPVLIVRVAAEKAPELPLDTPATVERLVVPIDGSDLSRRALPVAADLGSRLTVPIKLLMAVDFPMAGPAMGMDAAWGYEAGELLEEMESEASQQLKEARQALLDDHSKLDISMDVLRGPAASSVIRETVPTDVIILSSRGRSGFGRLLLGSVAEQLIRTGRCPVLLVRKPQS